MRSRRGESSEFRGGHRNRKIFSVLFAALTTLSMVLFATFDHLGTESTNNLYYSNSHFLSILPSPEWGLISAVLFAAMFAFAHYMQQKNLGFSWLTVALSGFFAVGVVFGKSYFISDSWNPIFKVPLYGIVMIAGMWMLLYQAVQLSFSFFDSIAARSGEKANHPILQRFIAWLGKHPFGYPLTIIAIVWIPFLILLFPGSTFWDGLVQLNQYFGYEARTDHHPWFSTMLLGLVVDLGQHIGGSYNAGLFLWVLLQSATCASIFAASISELIKDKAPNLLIVISLAFFAFSPTWISYAQNIYKDLLFSVFVLLALLISKRLIGEFKSEEGIAWKTLALLLVSLLLVCLQRKNGIYVSILIVIALLVLCKEFRASLTLVGTCMLCLVLVGQNVVAPSLGFTKGSVREALSLPFQQTARMVSEYPDDIPADCAEAIDGVLPIDKIGELYTPYISDPVKSSFRTDSDNEALTRYIVSWAKMATVHPDSYIQAFFSQTYAYWSPFVTTTNHADKFLFTSSHPEANQQPNVGNLEFSHLFGEDIGETLRKWCYKLSYIPLFGVVFQTGFYVWAYLLFFAYALKKRKRTAIALCVPFIAVVGICALSPVNGCMRYLMPLMATLPLLISCCLTEASRMPSCAKAQSE